MTLHATSDFRDSLQVAPSSRGSFHEIPLIAGAAHAILYVMAKMIQLRHVPDSVHRNLKSRAAKQGMSLSDYLFVKSPSLPRRRVLRKCLSASPRANRCSLRNRSGSRFARCGTAVDRLGCVCCAGIARPDSSWVTHRSSITGRRRSLARTALAGRRDSQCAEAALPTRVVVSGTSVGDAFRFGGIEGYPARACTPCCRAFGACGRISPATMRSIWHSLSYWMRR